MTELSEWIDKNYPKKDPNALYPRLVYNPVADAIMAGHEASLEGAKTVALADTTAQTALIVAYQRLKELYEHSDQQVREIAPYKMARSIYHWDDDDRKEPILPQIEGQYWFRADGSRDWEILRLVNIEGTPTWFGDPTVYDFWAPAMLPPTYEEEPDLVADSLGGDRKMNVQDVWPDIKCIDSTDENVSKFVFTKSNAITEAVLYKYPTYEERTVICCSTQSGCPVGCRFCGAGDSFVRSLSAEEIVAQVEHLFAARNICPAGVKRLQIMFMSMGEPMLNYKNLEEAIRTLYERYPNARLLISTSGPSVDYRPLRELSRQVPTVGLQFSVHESTDENRNKLIPFASKLDLEGIAFEGQMWFNATQRKPFFNYCAHEGNTSPDDVENLYALFDPETWEATVSVVCERDESIAAANERQRTLAGNFTSELLQKGYSVRTFDPAGQDDIGGGCGQLWFVQDWMKNNPDKAKPTVGRSLPVVHAPRCT